MIPRIKSVEPLENYLLIDLPSDTIYENLKNELITSHNEMI